MSKERPIIFNSEMVRAVLDGRKTVTRRVIKPQPSEGWGPDHYCEIHKIVDGSPDPNKPIGWGACSEDGMEGYSCPYGKPGDILYVRESYCPNYYGDDGHAYKADWEGSYVQIEELVPEPKWKPSIYMPKSAARIWLKVTDVRVERVQEISSQDAIAEGIENFSGYTVNPYRNYMKGEEGEMDMHCSSPVRSFQTLWDSINAKRKGGSYGWDHNPYVWAVKFEVISTKGKP